ncbi:satratoxin biosynthesis SC1 cluster protein 4 [Colletotrichum spaethianum]|uniref:phosphoethanolamine N-methyltransferase n=1 Tax=Colletotrichum spaethianum TaxID=700344 RepID=A0AA37UJQ6_9PEZI|nr:satratoxin biosynthesis SC1 cluster protein 4 [Colletotrichum spaethianum]GKT50114.1 satratoxin biosynthesis SC1 cluster protein 4 [Colletotrichum spaethianum]
MPSTRNAASEVPDMNLYKLTRVHRTLEKLKDKPEWTADDTKTFDCMHYLGDAAIESAAKELGLRAGEKVLDIGSGFGGTGRYLYRHYNVATIGIELQRDIHDIAQAINERSGAADRATSINGNFLELDPSLMGAPVNHIVSFLCILHIPERKALFKKACDVLEPGGRLYIEDFFARTALDSKTLEVLRGSVSCPYLPEKSHYMEELEKAGFEIINWADMSDTWTEFVHRRAQEYKKNPTVDADLTTFYDAVDEVFSGGQVGGTRITCQKK